MGLSQLDLNGGTFKVNLPYTWLGWLIWVIGLIFTLVGFASTATGEILGLAIAALGLMVMAFSSPVH